MRETTDALTRAAPALLAALNAAMDQVYADQAQGIEPPDWYEQAQHAVAMAAGETE
jgi:hypothetical protein